MLITVYEFCEYCLMPIRQPCDKECCYNFYILFASECASRSYAQVLVVSGATIFRLSFLGRMGRWMIWNARLLPKPFFYSMRIEILYATCIMWFLHNQPLKPVNPKNPNNNIFPHIPQTPPLVDISVITPQIRSPHVNNPRAVIYPCNPRLLRLTQLQKILFHWLLSLASFNVSSFPI